MFTGIELDIPNFAVYHESGRVLPPVAMNFQFFVEKNGKIIWRRPSAVVSLVGTGFQIFEVW